MSTISSASKRRSRYRIVAARHSQNLTLQLRSYLGPVKLHLTDLLPEISIDVHAREDTRMNTITCNTTVSACDPPLNSTPKQQHNLVQAHDAQRDCSPTPQETRVNTITCNATVSSCDPSPCSNPLQQHSLVQTHDAQHDCSPTPQDTPLHRSGILATSPSMFKQTCHYSIACNMDEQDLLDHAESSFVPSSQEIESCAVMDACTQTGDPPQQDDGDNCSSEDGCGSRTSLSTGGGSCQQQARGCKTRGILEASGTARGARAWPARRRHRAQQSNQFAWNVEAP